MLQTFFQSWKKPSPTHLYMIYPMAQSVVLVCVEKETRKCHCNGIVHLSSSSKNKISLNYLNFETSLTPQRGLLAQPTVHCVPARGPSCQGTDAPRHYPQTLIIFSFRGCDLFRTYRWLPFTSCVVSQDLNLKFEFWMRWSLQSVCLSRCRSSGVLLFLYTLGKK